jgi:hypothetical protein
VLFGIGTASGQEASSGLEYFSESMNHCRVTSAVALLGLAAFSGGMLYAVGKYPSEYDWHYTPISNLLTPARDLGGYLWASGGIVLCGLCGLCWDCNSAVSAWQAPPYRRTRCSACGRATKWSHCWPSSACLGLVSLMYCSLEQRFSRRRRGKARRARTSAALLAGGAVLPMLLAGLAQAYVFYVLPNLPWVSPAWRARGVPVVLSFAFWEWVTTAVVSAYFAALVLMADGESPPSSVQTESELGRIRFSGGVRTGGRLHTVGAGRRISRSLCSTTIALPSYQPEAWLVLACDR